MAIKVDLEPGKGDQELLGGKGNKKDLLKHLPANVARGLALMGIAVSSGACLAPSARTPTAEPPAATTAHTTSLELSATATVPEPTFTTEPTPTSTPTSTLTPTLEPTPTTEPTPTPTPTFTPEPTPIAKPTLTPEQKLAKFKESAEYKQGLQDYLNAMGLKEENVAITEEVKVINGEEYRFLVVSVEQSTLTDEQNKYSHLYQSKPLFLSIKSADKELKYKTIGLDSLGRLLNKRLATTGTYWDSSSPYEEVVLQNFDAIVTENDLNWKKIEPTKGTYKSSRVNHTNKLTEIDKKAFSVVGNSLVDSIPDWVLSNSPEVTRQNIRDHIKEMFEMFPEINEWVVMKEFGWDNDPLIGQLGSKYYLEVYQMARDVAKELGRESEIKLLYGDNNNHTVDSPAYSNTIKIVNALKEKNLIDGVTLHLHVWGDKNLDSASIENAVDSYGLPTYFQEIDINMKRVPVSRTDRLLQQADIEFEIVTAGANSENVVLIGHWLIGDNKSWYEIEGASPSDRYSKDADPTLFYDDLSPKPAYYAAIQALWNALSTQY